ncbi:MAG: 23S rRNA (pseudouridine(1915)-N(3))-methyltransferase RlmH [Planctomycetota bacterium]
MKVRLLCIGQRMPSWVDEGVAEFGRRLPREWDFEVVELPLGAKAKTVEPSKARALEAERLDHAAGPRVRRIALEVKGKALSSEQLSDRLSDWQQTGQDLAFLIGGPDGLDSELSRSCDERWSLSPLTMPHPLVRLVVVEQLYRAHTLQTGHPYHR